jgi:hypothetical protein
VVSTQSTTRYIYSVFFFFFFFCFKCHGNGDNCITTKNNDIYIMHLESPYTIVRNYPSVTTLHPCQESNQRSCNRTAKTKNPKNEVREKGCKKNEGNIISRADFYPLAVSINEGFQSQSLRQNQRSGLCKRCLSNDDATLVF